MVDSNIYPHFPLSRVSKSELRRLCRTLWSWEFCSICEKQSARCPSKDCASHQEKRLNRFLDYYKRICATYEPCIEDGARPILRTHEDLCSLIKAIREGSNVPRSELNSLTLIMSSTSPDREKNIAISMAVDVLTMFGCGSDQGNPALLEQGLNNAPWNPEESLHQFVRNSFTEMNHPAFEDTSSTSYHEVCRALVARKLSKHAGLSFKATENLRHHLRLDRKEGHIQIFHYTSFIKEHLRCTRDCIDSTTDGSMCFPNGVLPRQLCLEVLDSIQKVLFPLTDKKSRALLLSLVSSEGFDPDTLRFESTSIRRPDEKDIPFLFLGDRLANLYAELENPQPRNWLDKWLQRKSNARHVMLTTLVGVLIAVLLGICGLALAGFQAWISWQQWKHPVSN
ncbi:hypothetical protein NA57DRAFT_46618 [Rhizodiscina lignyota]|uniref:Uncharacterized protein n=1 Tax=Rhizodiscina lignyota TaxID=1504668 RepID=A0A9P4M630_9PEZI|nr:hypothetical protein NA57DRAFT_46618 [Rhizodiscina lignyota]